MFLRLLGEEEQALAWTGSHPFTDVPRWLDRYVAWAYAKGYSNGVAADRFGARQSMSAVEYTAFLLRALGYGAAGEDDYAASLERAAECGLRSFQIMAGALDGQAVETKLFSHEGVTGVGYGVAIFAVTGPDDDRRFGEQCAELERARLAEKKASEDPWVKLARLSLETFVKTGERLDQLPKGLPDEMTGQAAGAFVSLHARGQLRGCIGTTGPTTESVAWEIVQNAVSACARDPRFPPVTISELDSLEYSVDVLGQPEPIVSPAELDVKKYGVIVSCGGRRGLLLPDLEGVDTVEQQIDIARQKGGISAREKYTLERFEVVRHT